MPDLYVTGQNSDKIYLTAGLGAVMQGLDFSTAIYKPVDNNLKDFLFVNEIDSFIKTYSTYILKSNANPLLAAALEGRTIEPEIILRDFQQIKGLNECLIVDGISGFGTPINKNFLEEDLVKMLNISVLLSVNVQNTGINNILLSINHAKEVDVNLNGVILTSYPKNSENPDIKLMPRLIEEYTDIKILGILPEFDKSILPADLISEVISGVDIEAVFQLKIAKLN